MALHARELVRCAATALGRQLQMYTRVTSGHQGLTPQSLAPISRSVAISTPGSGASRGGSLAQKSGPKVTKAGGEAGKVRIKYATPSYVLNQRRFTPERASASSRKSAKGPLGKARHARHRSEGSSSKYIGAGNKINLDSLRSEALSSKDRPRDFAVPEPSSRTGADLLHHRATKVQKKRQSKSQSLGLNHASLTEPVSKLAKDINQWFNDVLEHIVNTEKAAAAAATKKGQTVAPVRLQRSGKSATPRSTEAIKDGQTIGYHQGTLSKKPVQLLVTSRRDSTSDVKSWMPKPTSASTASNRAADTSANSDAQLKLEHQISVLNAEMARHREELEKLRRKSIQDASLPGTGKAPGDAGSASAVKRKKKMLEIKPSLVENTDVTDQSLVSAAAWWPYGAPSDTLPGISDPRRSRSSAGRDSPLQATVATTCTTGPAAMATTSTNMASASSHHQVAAASADGGALYKNVRASSSKSSLEKGKGFILLNNKDKAREAEEWKMRRAAASNSPSRPPKTKSTQGNSFILVESEGGGPSTSPAGAGKTKTRVNRVLSDNPHVMSAKGAYQKNQAPLEVHTKSDIAYEATSGQTEKTGSGATKGHGFRGKQPETEERISSQNLDTQSGAGSGSEVPISPDPTEVTWQWAERIDRKLAQIQSAKQAQKTLAKSRQKDSIGKAATSTDIQRTIIDTHPKQKKLGQEVASVKSSQKPIKTIDPSVADKNKRTYEPRAISAEEMASLLRANDGKYRQPRKPQSSRSLTAPGAGTPTAAATAGTRTTKAGEAVSQGGGGRSGTSEGSGADSTLSHPLYGPLTFDQHLLLQKVNSAGIGDKSEVVTHPYLQRKAVARRVSIGELKPDLASPTTTKEKHSSSMRLKSEPKLCVAPEEIQNSNRLRSAKSASSKNKDGPATSKVRSSPPITTNLSTAEAPLRRDQRAVSPSDAKEMAEYQMWSSMLQSRLDDYRALVQTKPSSGTSSVAKTRLRAGAEAASPAKEGGKFSAPSSPKSRAKDGRETESDHEGVRPSPRSNSTRKTGQDVALTMRAKNGSETDEGTASITMVKGAAKAGENSTSFMKATGRVNGEITSDTRSKDPFKEKDGIATTKKSKDSGGVKSELTLTTNAKDGSKVRQDVTPALKEKAANTRPKNEASSDTRIFSNFEKEYLKLQHDKLIRSLRRNIPSNKDHPSQSPTTVATQSGGTLVSTPAGGHPMNRPLKAEGVESPQANKQRDADHSAFANAGQDAKTSSTAIDVHKSRHTSDAGTGDLDPFEAWIRSMEDAVDTSEAKSSSKAAKVVGKASPTLNTKSENLNRPVKLSVETDEKCEQKRNQYPRFEQTSREIIAQEMHRDMRATYAMPPQGRGRPGDEDKAQAQREAPKIALSQSDLIFKQIHDGARSPSCGMKKGQRSKVLTQAGMGAVTSSTTGLVDPARMPKIGNLFNSLDGFIAMEAVPVLDKADVTRAATTPTQADASRDKSLTSSKASGDGRAGGEDLRTSLAREREIASAATRRKLIEVYEKNIEKYEKGLELYRSKLRQARRDNIESELPTARSSDNPRRHTDL